MQMPAVSDNEARFEKDEIPVHGKARKALHFLALQFLALHFSALHFLALHFLALQR